MDKTTLLIYESLCLLRYSRGLLHEEVEQVSILDKEDKWQWLQSMDHTIERLELFMREINAKENDTRSSK